MLAQIDADFSFVFVDDGSKDATADVVRHLINNGLSARLVKLSRNFGKDAALSAGLDHADGEAVIVMDVDLQDPPHLICEFVDLWRKGFHVIYAARRSRRSDTFLKRVTATGFYKIFNAFATTQIPVDAGDFRLMDRRVVEAVKTLPERERFMKGLFAWVGFSHTAVPYDRPPRNSGETKWTYLRLFRFAVDGITSFSSLPLTIWTLIGFSVSFFAAIWALYILTRTFVFGIDVPGYASTIVVILFLGGLQLFGLGIIGEYLSRVFREVKGRPVYIVDRTEQSAMPLLQLDLSQTDALISSQARHSQPLSRGLE